MGSKRKSCFGAGAAGFFIGVLCTAGVLYAFVRYTLSHPQKIVKHAGTVAVNRVVVKTVESAPRDYIGKNQADIARSVQGFADAFSKNRISQTDMQRLAGKMFAMVADQRITEKEMADMLRTMNAMAGI